MSEHIKSKTPQKTAQYILHTNLTMLVKISLVKTWFGGVLGTVYTCLLLYIPMHFRNIRDAISNY